VADVDDQDVRRLVSLKNSASRPAASKPSIGPPRADGAHGEEEVARLEDGG